MVKSNSSLSIVYGEDDLGRFTRFLLQIDILVASTVCIHNFMLLWRNRDGLNATIHFDV